MAMASTEAEAEPGLRENNYNLFRQQTPYYSKLLMIFVFIFFLKKNLKIQSSTDWYEEKNYINSASKNSL